MKPSVCAYRTSRASYGSQQDVRRVSIEITEEHSMIKSEYRRDWLAVVNSDTAEVTVVNVETGERLTQGDLIEIGMLQLAYNPYQPEVVDIDYAEELDFSTEECLDLGITVSTLSQDEINEAEKSGYRQAVIKMQ
jgi:hypothetical protein